MLGIRGIPGGLGSSKKEDEMKKLLCVIFITALVSLALPVNAADVLVEPFDNASQFSVTTGAFFSDGAYDYFGLSAPADDWGSGTAPSGLKAYTGFTGSFLTGMDLDGDGGPVPVVIEWTGLDITGMTGLQFSGDFAEYFDSPGDIDVANDQILVQYQVDGGGYQNLIAFEGDGSNGDYNGNFAQDTNFDGTGDGTVLTGAAQNFSATIPESGTTLDIKLTVFVDAGDEDFAVDNFSVTGTVPVELQSFSIE